MGASLVHKYKLQKHDGIAAIIIYKSRVLLLKRRNLPIILNPGVWSFLFGGRDKKERYLDNAYREIKEEVNIKKSQLKLLYRGKILLKYDKRRIMWPNRLFIFKSSTDKIKLDIENKSYRWASISEIEKEINYTNIFINEEQLLNRIKGFLNESKKSNGKN